MIDRRAFVATSIAGVALPATAKLSATSRPASGGASGAYDPRLTIERTLLRRNVTEVARLAGGRPILAVVKNNAYGLGLDAVGPVLDAAPEVWGLAVVTTEEALALRAAGVRKPILLMALTDDAAAFELALADVRLAAFADDAPERLAVLAARLGRAVRVHAYFDTGMGRLGVPFRRAADWMARLAAQRGVAIEGAFMAFVEDDAVDPVQCDRFRALAEGARARGISLGRLHAASSHGLFFRTPALLDMVRPGLVLYGAYPAGARERGVAALTPAWRLTARVVRVTRLEPGDGVSYGYRFVAERPTWIATLPVGHADGYPRSAVRGCEVLIGDRVYPVIGAVSASHTIVSLGDEATAAVGDTAVLVGPDHPAIHPNTVAERAGVSVYDVLMHLSARLPRSLA